MVEKNSKPADLFLVTVYLDTQEYVSLDMSFNDFINLMWCIKTMSFISIWNKIFNKMHIVWFKSWLSPIVSMNVSEFIHSVSTNPTKWWMTREECYTERCDKSIKNK